jgi:hypothetical protein
MLGERIHEVLVKEAGDVEQRRLAYTTVMPRKDETPAPGTPYLLI